MFCFGALSVFRLCMKYLGNRWTGLLSNSHGRHAWCLARVSLKVNVKGQGHQGQNGISGTKRYFSALSAACVRFMFGKTSLACSFEILLINCLLLIGSKQLINRISKLQAKDVLPNINRTQAAERAEKYRFVPGDLDLWHMFWCAMSHLYKSLLTLLYLLIRGVVTGWMSTLVPHFPEGDPESMQIQRVYGSIRVGALPCTVIPKWLLTLVADSARGDVWQLGLVVARWSRSTKLLYVRPG